MPGGGAWLGRHGAGASALVCAAALLSACCTTRGVAVGGSAAKFAMCEDLGAALKPRLKIGGFVDTVAGGGGALIDLSRPQVAAEQVSAMKVMVFQCQLWARGEPGHDADRLSDIMLRLSKVYVAAPDVEEREARLKVLEGAFAKLSSPPPGVEAPVKPMTASQKDDILAKATGLANRPEAMAAERKAVEADSISASSAPVKQESRTFYAFSETEADDLKRLAGLAAANDKSVADLKARVETLERPGVRSERTHVLFASNVSTLDLAARQSLDELAARAAQRSARVVGYADAVGASARNHQLSEARAQAVTAVLTAAGVDVVETIGSGPTALFPGGPAANRRVVIELVPAQ